jgi:hypothetical protein
MLFERRTLKVMTIVFAVVTITAMVAFLLIPLLAG